MRFGAFLEPNIVFTLLKENLTFVRNNLLTDGFGNLKHIVQIGEHNDKNIET